MLRPMVLHQPPRSGPGPPQVGSQRLENSRRASWATATGYPPRLSTKVSWGQIWTSVSRAPPCWSRLRPVRAGPSQCSVWPSNLATCRHGNHKMEAAYPQSLPRAPTQGRRRLCAVDKREGAGSGLGGTVQGGQGGSRGPTAWGAVARFSGEPQPQDTPSGSELRTHLQLGVPCRGPPQASRTAWPQEGRPALAGPGDAGGTWPQGQGQHRMCAWSQRGPKGTCHPGSRVTSPCPPPRSPEGLTLRPWGRGSRGGPRQGWGPVGRGRKRTRPAGHSLWKCF